jgi:phospholipase C
MDDAFARLISVWRKAALADDPELIADALWLASYLPVISPETTPPADVASELEGTAPSVDPETEDSQKRSPPSVPLGPESPTRAAQLFHKQSDSLNEKTISASAVTIAAAAALPNPLVLSRALRPFSRRLDSRNRTEFDEEQTAEDTARNKRRPTPRFRPLAERWFDVALVVEDTTSMAIWRRTLQEFRLLLERQGSFRDVRTWRLQPGGKLLDRHTLRRASAINDVTGRRLILIVSDCVSRDWYNGVIAAQVLRWGKQTPVAIIQVLPARAWVHTALGGPSSTLQSSRPGLPTVNLNVERDWWSAVPARTAITIPVIPLDCEEVLRWARMVMGMGGATYPGIVLDAEPQGLSGHPETKPNVSTPQMLVDSYRSLVSPEAFELAQYLAAAPLSLPVMRLIQQTMFGDRARQFHLAEFFLGSLIRKVADASDPDDTTYDFQEGVRAILLETLQRNHAFEIIRKVSRFVESRIGQPLDWLAIVRDPVGTCQVPDAAMPFARVASEVLGRSGLRQAGTAGEQQEFRMTAGLQNLKHIVVLMMENRSFDHMLGSLKMVDSRINGLNGDESNLDTTNDPARVQPLAEWQSQLDPSPHHHFAAVHQQIFDGGSINTPTMGGFVKSYYNARRNVDHSRQIMYYFPQEKLPVLTGLARNFAVFNGWFSSIPGPTLCNHAFVHFGTSFGQVGMRNFSHHKQPLSIYERLVNAGHSAKLYYFDEASMEVANLFQNQPKLFGTYDQFLEDCKLGKLPQYSLVEPNYTHHEINGQEQIASDQHPGHDVQQGEVFIATVYNAIRQNRDLWASTALLIVYDEHGGIYDHVPPPSCPKDGFTASPEQTGVPGLTFQFDRLGVRVPAILVSPWIAKATVVPGPGEPNGRAFEHASIPRTVTKFFVGDYSQSTPREQQAPTFLDLLSDHMRPDADCPIFSL